MDLPKSSVLFVDDESMILDALKRVCRKLYATVFTAHGGHEALEIIKNNQIDIIVSDINMPNMDGITFLEKVSKISPESIRIILTAYTDVNNTLAAINEGKVWGYLNKPWDNTHLINTLNQVIEFRKIMVERTLLKEFKPRDSFPSIDKFSGFVGSSAKMQNIYQTIKQCAPCKASVFITGPSGSGKEVAAQALHELSRRKEGSFIALNCAAIPAELMESEIFGHVKGAFSGAHSNRDGAATLAHNGTLFLDEIAEMDIILQAKLLRFIQTGTFSRVGSGKVEKVDVRFISATNREPDKAIAENKLREDLFYRLNVLPIALPPLNERGSDVVQIAEVFLQKYNQIEERNYQGFTPLAKKLLRKYQWPGNVRQLQNLIYSAVVLANEPLIDEHIFASILNLSDEQLSLLLESEDVAQIHEKATDSNIPIGECVVTDGKSFQDNSKIYTLASVERKTIEHALSQCNDNVVKAAEALGVSPSTLYRKIQQWQDSAS
ncbi:sigma-54 dependent transcriptional regulator [Thalassotalea nanhaiensis]|uniref:Sigma-54 dependent transcriptional regulator n=1 Tax=Thalassotalea nanhaiensis TaxID=3065648 RepID=A0ABY9TN78_9GAMM|nr:sigma-54 dependent transcriptional regulator [Colwelliaceae bacterium SQ345]